MPYHSISRDEFYNLKQNDPLKELKLLIQYNLLVNVFIKLHF